MRHVPKITGMELLAEHVQGGSTGAEASKSETFTMPFLSEKAR